LYVAISIGEFEKNSTLSLSSTSQTWLSPLVDDRHSTYITKLKKQKKQKKRIKNTESIGTYIPICH
jgi:hypothetical protein